MASRAKRQKPTLTFRDSQDPDTITLAVADHYRPGVIVQHRMTIAEAAELSQRLAVAVHMSGFDMVARRRKAR